MLDLILCSHEERVGTREVLPPLPGCSHCVAVCTYLFQNNVNDTECMTVSEDERLWTRGDYESMVEFPESVDWVFEFLYLDVAQQYDRFVQILQQLINVYVPLRQTGKAKLLIHHKPLGCDVGTHGRTIKTSEAVIKGIVPTLLGPGQTLLKPTVNIKARQ